MRGLYSMTVGADMVSPVEFWQLHPWEVFWLIDAKTANSEPRRREERNESLYETLKAAREKKGDQRAGYSLDDIKRKRSEAKAEAVGAAR